jgi:hypothetical protein
MEISVKTIIALLTTTMLVAGATSAMAVEQGSDEAPGYALSLRAAQGFGAAQTVRSFGGAFASARAPGVVHHRTMDLPANGDFQLQGR